MISLHEWKEFKLKIELEFRSQILALKLEKSLSDIQRELVNILLDIPALNTFEGRNRLLDDLPKISLNRSEINAQLDFENIVRGLSQFKRQDEKQPLIVIINNAANYIPKDTELANHLNKIREELQAYFSENVLRINS